MIRKWDDQNALMYLIKKLSEWIQSASITWEFNTQHMTLSIQFTTALQEKSGHRNHSTKQRTPSTGVNTSINNSITVFHNVIVIKSQIQLLAWNKKSKKNVLFG